MSKIYMPIIEHDDNVFINNTYYGFERFSRIKHNGFHEISENFIKHPKIPLQNLENLVTLKNILVALSNKTVKFKSKKDQRIMLAFKRFKPATFWDKIKVGTTTFIDHHLSHASTAYYTSHFKKTDMLIFDGSGENFRTIFIDKDFKIYDLSNVLSIGMLWWVFARLYKTHGSAKLMGMVGYGTYNKDFLKMIESIHKIVNGTIKIDKIEVVSRFIAEINLIDKFDAAKTLQIFTLKMVLKYIKNLQTSKNICVSGGVAYNGYINECLYTLYDSVHVPFAPGDEGHSLGLYLYDKAEHINLSPYLGIEYDLDNLETKKKSDYKVCKNLEMVYYSDSSLLLEGLYFKKMNFEDLTKDIASEIANGKTIAWFQGRSEAGHRALGNRSILADPRNPNIKEHINNNIKLREDFRPFAPTVLEEHYKEYFDTPEPSPYMNRIVKVISDKIPGVTHVDKTARIQTLTREQNQRFYDLIKEFYKITGVPILLNTSFNCQEPIVETPLDAIKTFKRTGLDTLIIGDYKIWK